MKCVTEHQGTTTSSSEPHSVAYQVVVLRMSTFRLQSVGAGSSLALSGYGRKRDREKGRVSRNLAYSTVLASVLRVCKSLSDYTDITPGLPRSFGASNLNFDVGIGLKKALRPPAIAMRPQTQRQQ